MLLTPDQTFPDPFPKGAILLIDKPFSWSSFDVVNRTRYLLVRRTGNKKLKVGHAGTLDPLATGLLILCAGDFTKRIDEFQAMPKEYTGTITFGATRPSFDREKAVDATFPTDHLNDALLEQARHQFIGDILQVPPIFSAVKVDGKRLYKNARTGQEVEMPHRSVHVSTFELGPLRPVPTPEHDGLSAEASPPSASLWRVKAEEGPIVVSKKGPPIMFHPEYAAGVQCDFRVVCSKGTYIRSLAHDLGQAVGSGAYLSSLCRTATGGFSLEGAWEMEGLGEWAVVS